MNSNLSTPNRWQGLVLGFVGSIAGLLAMRFYWQVVAPVVAAHLGEQGSEREEPSEAGALDDISLVGPLYEGDESSTAALGRLLYSRLTGQPPRSKELKRALSYLVHWAYGLAQGACYGALRADARGLDVGSGLAFGSSLWLFGDEVAVPLLGLQRGPTAVSPVQHANRLGAHLAYGLGTAAATQALRRLV